MEAIGHFTLTSETLVASDPGYDLADMPLLGALLAPAAPGRWHVSFRRGTEADHRPGELAELFAYHEEFLAPERMSLLRPWHEHPDPIGEDGGIIGIFDKAHYGDATILPAGYNPWAPAEIPATYSPASLWYDFLCNSKPYGLPFKATIVPFGCLADWNFDARVFTAADAGGMIRAVHLRASEPDAS